MEINNMPLRDIQDALEGHIDSSRVGRLARRIVRYEHFAVRTVAYWLHLPYERFLLEVAAYPELAQCGVHTWHEWQIALQCLCDGDPPYQRYPYAD